MIKIIKDDVFNYKRHYENNKFVIIVHQVNCQGVMGAGIAKIIKQRYPEVFSYYKNACDTVSIDSLLGQCQLTPVIGENLCIANLFAQERYGRDKRYTDYDAFDMSLKRLRSYICHLTNSNVVIRIPYGIGCGLAGGDWNTIQNLIQDNLNQFEVEICKLGGD